MPQIFKDFDLSSVWEFNSWADKDYKEAPFTPEILAAVESELGYKLPQSFIALMAVQNGGIFVKNCFPTTQRNSWAEDHVQMLRYQESVLKKKGASAARWGKNFGWKNGNIRLSACILLTTHLQDMPCLPWTTESVEKTESRKWCLSNKNGILK